MKMGAFVLGYHGCDKEVGEKILAGKADLKTNEENTWDWLGHGIYFWENNPKRAKEWAQFKSKLQKKAGEKPITPFAIGAIIDVGNCLDLTEARSLQIAKEGYKSLKEIFDISGVPLPENRNSSEKDSDRVYRNLDCAVINHVHRMRKAEGFEDFNTVRGFFHEGGSLYPGSGYMSKTHIQICVRKPSSILGVFRIKGLDKL